jgi:hypothetical protein
MFSPFTQPKAPGKPEDEAKRPEGPTAAGQGSGSSVPQHAGVGQAGSSGSGHGTAAGHQAQRSQQASEIAELKAELANMQRKLDKLSGSAG